jgi:hypothetical protein
MDILIRRQFHHRPALVSRDGKHVQHGAVRGREGWNLGVEARMVEAFVDRAHVAHYQ